MGLDVTNAIKEVQKQIKAGKVTSDIFIQAMQSMTADVGGVGDRYTCMIQGKERELWFEDGRWFVAAKVVTKQTPSSDA